MIPSIELQDALVIARKLTGLLCLPEHAGARPEKHIVKQPLMERSLPAICVQHLERLSTRCHAVKTRRSHALPLCAHRLHRSQQHRRAHRVCLVKHVVYRLKRNHALHAPRDTHAWQRWVDLFNARHSSISCWTDGLFAASY